jgi:outer membrane biosynthesis protein TonB
VAVDEQGRLADTLVIGHSHPRFAEAAVGALAQWQFHPARGRDGPILSVTPLNFVFRNDGQGASVTAVPAAESGETLPPLPTATSLLVPFSDLDRLPTPVHLVSPAYSDEDARRNAGKKVVVQFYIDEAGKVRMPTLTYADDLAVARRAIAAVAEWRFLPPKFQDRPVVTRASQTFKF